MKRRRDRVRPVRSWRMAVRKARFRGRWQFQPSRSCGRDQCPGQMSLARVVAKKSAVGGKIVVVAVEQVILGAERELPFRQREGDTHIGVDTSRRKQGQAQCRQDDLILLLIFILLLIYSAIVRRWNWHVEIKIMIKMKSKNRGMPANCCRTRLVGGRSIHRQCCSASIGSSWQLRAAGV